MKKLISLLILLLASFHHCVLAETLIAESDIAEIRNADLSNVPTSEIESIVEQYESVKVLYDLVLNRCMTELAIRQNIKADVPESFSDVDLSSMGYWELVALKDKINMAMWLSEEWQEVTVPQGVWKVGEDIPAGHWTIKAKSANTSVKYGTKLDEVGKDVSYTSNEYYYSGLMHNPDAVMSFDPNYHISQIDLMVKDGRYIVIDGGSVIFTPYTGKPSLGFK